jgi:hypothetical protein
MLKNCEGYSMAEIEECIDSINPKNKDKILITDEIETRDWFYFGAYAYINKPNAKWNIVFEDNKTFLVRK